MTLEPTTRKSGVTRSRILESAMALGALGTGQNTIALILATLCNPQATAEQVARAIAQEPGLAARVLRVANSAYYGASGSVATLERAFVLLGVDAVRGIAAAACLNRATSRMVRTSPVDMGAMLRHSIGTAAAAEALARIARRSLAPEAFIAGLLHDFGTTLQLQLDRDGLAALASALRAEPLLDLRQAEERLVGVGHEFAAAVVFEAWKLPATVFDVVRHHHDPVAAPEAVRMLASLVHLGDHLSIACGQGYDLESAVGPVRGDVLAMLPLLPQDIERVAEALPDKVRELQRVLSDS